MPVIGYLNDASSTQFTHLLAAFRKGLSETGFVEGRNVAIEYRYADGQYDRLPALAADLVNQRVADGRHSHNLGIEVDDALAIGEEVDI
jgi:putative ABC transport system substrate-binding protein